MTTTETTAHRFENVSCSQCGRSFGPGAAGFSACVQHQRPLAEGDEVEVTRGSLAIASKGERAKVTRLADFEGGVNVTLRFCWGSVTVWVRYRKRLADATIHGHDGNPLHRIDFRRLGV